MKPVSQTTREEHGLGEQVAVAGERDANARVLRLAIWTFAGASVLAAGVMMWASQGETVFASLVSAAIAWCF